MPRKRTPSLGKGDHYDRSKEALHSLTTDNSALILVDHQVGLMTGVRDYETGELKHNVVALAKAAKVLRIPTVVTTTARDSMWGPTFPELVEVVGGEHIIDRSSVNAWDDRKVAAAIEATGRKKLIFVGCAPAFSCAARAVPGRAPVCHARWDANPLRGRELGANSVAAVMARSCPCIIDEIHS
jgi:isochorismatase family protein